MSSDNYYNQQRYKTQKGIEEIHKVKYELIQNEIEFEEAYTFLNENKYVSIIAEKQRMPYYKKKLKLIGIKKRKEEQFAKLCRSFLLSIDKDFKLEDLESNIYHQKHNNIYKIIYIPNEKFVCTFIHKDVIYIDKFTLLNLESTKTKVEILKSMKTPFSLDRTSLLSNTIRLDFRFGWKKYIKEIEEGIN